MIRRYDCVAEQQAFRAAIFFAPSWGAQRVARIQSPENVNPASKRIVGFFYLKQ
jgi:hypothetical protein